MTCRGARRRMTLAYYHALGARAEAALARHLAGCEACRRGEADLRRTLDAALAAVVFPREAEVDWNAFARATVARARAAEAAAASAGGDAASGGRFVRGPWARAASLVSLAAAAGLAAVLIGVWTRPGAPPGVPPGAHDAQAQAALLDSARVMEGRVARRGAEKYLIDSRAILVNLAGPAAPCRRADGRFDLTIEKDKTRQLLRRKNLYEGDLDGLQDARTAALMKQLESVLLQISALEDCATARQIHDLRQEIESRRILMRIDLLTRELRGRTDVV